MSELATVRTAPGLAVGGRVNSAKSLLMSTGLCAGVTLSFLVVSNSFFHWFVLPVMLCGIVIGTDAVDWARRRLDVFDPVGIIGLVGFHSFFLAPMLHVLLGYWMRYVVPPLEWRDWLGYMAGLNLIGLLLYRWSRSWPWPIRAQKVNRYWPINESTLPVVLAFGLIISASLQAYVFATYGGIGGYISAATEIGQAAFVGTGWILTISESFPIIALIAFVVWLHGRTRRPSWLVLSLMLLVFVIVQLLFGGLRGSRSNTIWAIFWAVGLVHLWLRPVPRKLLAAGLLLTIAFMYVYGFYKAAGVSGLLAVQDPLQRTQIEQTTDRSLSEVILEDFARADVQAYLAYRLTTFPHEYDLAFGRSYLGDLALLIPRQVWPDRPPTKIRFGTDAQLGNGAYMLGALESSRVYGLSGEAMLNFGPVAAPLALVILGVLVRAVRRLQTTLRPDDTRTLLVPIAVSFCCAVLLSDLDNDLFFLIKFLAIPFLVITLGSRRVRAV